MNEKLLYFKFDQWYNDTVRDLKPSKFKSRWIAYEAWLEGVKLGRELKESELKFNSLYE